MLSKEIYLPDLERLCILESFSLVFEGDDLVAGSALSVEAIVNIAGWFCSRVVVSIRSMGFGGADLD